MASAKSGVHILSLDELDVDRRLLEGEKFLKWCEQEATSPTSVTLRVDPNGFFLQWVDQTNKEIKFLDISQIRDVRTGSAAKVPKDLKLREIVSMGQGELEDRTVTVVYGTDFVNSSFINFCSRKVEVAELWHDQLQNIIKNVLAANISSLQALQKIFTQLRLMANSDDKIPMKSIIKLFAQHKDDRKAVEKALEKSGLPSHKNDAVAVEKLGFEDFFNFYTHLVPRKEVETVFKERCKTEAKKKVMTMEEFMHFVNGQRDPRLNEILFPYCTLDKALELIQRYEQNPVNKKKKHLSLDGFLRYLLSEENQIVAPELFDLHDDMSLPLSHYFIQSSHNTYLTGHQWTGKSSVEMYRQVLLAGCRCIELDLWDGKTKDEEPVIVHGYTLVPEILAKDVILAIAESAFKTSDFPVILSFENHCRAKQQAKIAQYCKEYFGDMLLTESLEEWPLEPGRPLPSPAALKRKILVKNKKKHASKEKSAVGLAVATSAAVRLESSAATLTTASATASSISTDQESIVKQTSLGGGGGLNNADDESPCGVDSDSDTDDDELPQASNSSTSGASMVPSSKGGAVAVGGKNDKRQKEARAAEEISALVNYIQPVRFHSFESAERKNRSYEMSSFDEANAVSLLKEFPTEFVKYNKRQISRIFPRGTRLDSSNFIPQVFWNAGCQLVALNYQTLDLPMQLNLGIYEYNKRCGYLRKPVFMTREDRVFDPFADTPVDGIVPGTVSIQILSGQFLTDKHVGTYVEVDMYGLPCDTVRRKFRTRVVPNNGICPQFNDEPFVFKQVVLPDLAALRIAVFEESGRLIGHRVIPVKGIRPGYRHMSLRNEAGQFLTLPTLFVHVKVHDYVPDRFSDFAEALANPIRYQSELDKRTQQLMVLTGEDEEDNDEDDETNNLRKPSPEKTPDIDNNSLRAMKSASTTIEKDDDSPAAAKPETAELSPASFLPLSNSANSSTGPRSVSLRGFSGSFGRSFKLPVSKSNSVQKRSSPQAEEGGSAAAAAAPTEEESVDAFLKHKLVLDKIAERDKKVAQINKKYQKDLEKLNQSLQSQKDKALKMSVKGKDSKTKLMKILSDKTMSTLHSSASANQSSPDEADEKLQKHQALYEEKLKALAEEKEKTEGDINSKYVDIVMTTLEKQLRTSQQHQVKLLQMTHERECADVIKKVEAQVEQEIKDPKEKDKEELLRLKKEKRSFIVKRGTEERRKLNELHKQKLEEMSKKHEDMKKSLVNEMVAKKLLQQQQDHHRLSTTPE